MRPVVWALMSLLFACETSSSPARAPVRGRLAASAQAIVGQAIEPYDLASLWPNRVYERNPDRPQVPFDLAYDQQFRIGLTTGFNGLPLVPQAVLDVFTADLQLPVEDGRLFEGLSGFVVTGFFLDPCVTNHAISGAGSEAECAPMLRLSLQEQSFAKPLRLSDGETVGQYWRYDDESLHLGFGLSIEQGKAFVRAMQSLGQEYTKFPSTPYAFFLERSVDGDFTRAFHPNFDSIDSRSKDFSLAVKTLLAAYATRENLALCSLMSAARGDVRNHSRWRFVNYAIDGERVSRATVPGATGSEVHFESHLVTVEHGIKTVEPLSLFAQAFANEAERPIVRLSDEQKQAVAVGLNALENPELTGRKQTDCVSCHISRTVALKVLPATRRQAAARYVKPAPSFVSRDRDWLNVIMFGIAPEHYLDEERFGDASGSASVSERFSNELSLAVAHVRSRW